MDGIDVDICLDRTKVGGVFCQILSGDEYNRCLLESVGAFSIVRGHVVCENSCKTVKLPFEASVAHAESVSVRDSFQEFIRDRCLPPPALLSANHVRTVVIKATQFPIHCPIESIVLEMTICSAHGSEAELPSLVQASERGAGFDSEPNEKDIWIMQATVGFKSYDSIRLQDPHKGFTVKEILLDKITLHSWTVTMPKDLSKGVSIANVALPQPVSLLDRMHSKIAMFLLNPNYVIEFFVFAIVVTMWLLYRSYRTAHATDSERLWDTLFTALSAAILIILIFVLRGLLSSRLGNMFQLGREYKSRSFFVNGWQGWSFCGAVMQGTAPPIYSMPNMFVQSFHHAGMGTALPINQGKGSIPFYHSLPAHAAKIAVSSPIGSDSGGFDLGNSSSSSLSAAASASAAHAGVPSLSLPSATAHTGSAGQSQRYPTAPSESCRDFIASDMFTVLADTDARYAIVVGFLSQQQQFGCIACNRDYNQLSVHVSGDQVLVPSQGRIVTDPLVLYTVDTSLETSLDLYVQLAGKMNDADKMLTSDKKPFHGIPTGWCSWYHYYQNITAHNLAQNLTVMNEVQNKRGLAGESSLQLFQVDDGYSTRWGDWLSVKPSFSAQPMSSFVQEIRRQSMHGGIWLAPFACDKDSELARLHPDWILCLDNQHRQAANSANCGKFFYGLDVTNPAVQAYVRHVLRTVVEDWGFCYVKLDFLYAAALAGSQPSVYDRKLTKAQIVRLGMSLLVDELEKTGKPYYLLGCGAPLGSLIGMVHANRVSAGKRYTTCCVVLRSPSMLTVLCVLFAVAGFSWELERECSDAGSSWLPSFPLPYTDKWNLPCARNMVRNTLTRLFMHNRWWVNDPDCLLLGKSLPFSKEELIGIATSKALSGGSMIVSDDLAAVSPERWDMFLKLLPPTNQPAVAVDLFEQEMPELFRLKCYKSKFRAHSSDNASGGGDAAGIQAPSPMQRGVSIYSDDSILGPPLDRGSNGSASRVPPEPPDILLWRQVSRSAESTFSPGASYDEMDSRTSHPSLNTDASDDILVELPSDMRSLQLNERIKVAGFSPLRDPISRLDEDQVLTALFPSPTVYTRKPLNGPIVRTLSRTNSASNGSKTIRSEGIACGMVSRSNSIRNKSSNTDHDVSLTDEERHSEERDRSHPSHPLALKIPKGLPPHPTRSAVPMLGPTHAQVSASSLLEDLVPITVEDADDHFHDTEHDQDGGPGHLRHDVSASDVLRIEKPQTHTSSTASLPSHSDNDNSFCSSLGSQIPSSERLISPQRGYSSTVKNLEVAIKRYVYNPHDLHPHWYLFTACNWSENQPSAYPSPSPSSSMTNASSATSSISSLSSLLLGAPRKKSHFVYIGDIFTPQELQLFIDYLDILYNKYKFRTKHTDEPSRVAHTAPSSAKGPLQDGPESVDPAISPFKSFPVTTPNESSSLSAFSTTWNTQFSSQHRQSFESPVGKSATESINYKVILHKFDFWNESYSHKIISLDAVPDEELGEVVFSDIPSHSASVFHLSLSLHPMRPLYIGSNLHISNGYEVKRMSILHCVPVLHKHALVAYCSTAMPRKRSKSNIFSSAISASVTPKICSIAIVLEGDVLRRAGQSGWIFVFLPVSYRKARAYNHVMGMVEVSGSASAKQMSPIDDAQDEHGRGREVEMVAYLEEAPCFTAGYIYKIPVRKARDDAIGFNSWVSNSHEKGEGASSTAATPAAGGRREGGSTLATPDVHRPLSVQWESKEKISSQQTPAGRVPLKNDHSTGSSAAGTPQGNLSNPSAKEKGKAATAVAEEGDRDYVIISWIYSLIESAPPPPPSTVTTSSSPTKGLSKALRRSNSG